MPRAWQDYQREAQEDMYLCDTIAIGLHLSAALRISNGSLLRTMRVKAKAS